MNVLVADDDEISRKLAATLLRLWGHEPVLASDGDEAWTLFTGRDAPRLGVIDWNMPGMSGVDICRRLMSSGAAPRYVILVTARGGTENVIAGLDAGADDYVTKPFSGDELHARVRAGIRALALLDALAARAAELEASLARVQQLEGLIPICAWCKKIKRDDGTWESVERYIEARSAADFTHSICPPCHAKVEMAS